ncbi:MAG: hypothetical protein VB140_09095, partial [Burkholderia sp.]
SPFASASSTAWRTSLVRNPFVSPELCPSDAIASSRSIYATTPPHGMACCRSHRHCRWALLHKLSGSR